jgi:hypothetical protein
VLCRFQHREVLTYRLCGRLSADAAHDVCPGSCIAPANLI